VPQSPRRGRALHHHINQPRREVYRIAPAPTLIPWYVTFRDRRHHANAIKFTLLYHVLHHLTSTTSAPRTLLAEGTLNRYCSNLNKASTRPCQRTFIASESPTRRIFTSPPYASSTRHPIAKQRRPSPAAARNSDYGITRGSFAPSVQYSLTKRRGCVRIKGQAESTME
jgi:hypothetical protein